MASTSPVVSGAKTLAADPSSPVDCEVELTWIELVGQVHPTDPQLDLKPFLNNVWQGALSF